MDAFLAMALCAYMGGTGIRYAVRSLCPSGADNPAPLTISLPKKYTVYLIQVQVITLRSGIGGIDQQTYVIAPGTKLTIMAAYPVMNSSGEERFTFTLSSTGTKFECTRSDAMGSLILIE